MRVWCIAFDRPGNAWFGTNRGAACLDTHGKWTVVAPRNSGLANENVYGITQTEDGALWFATAAGVSRWQPQRLL